MKETLKNVLDLENPVLTEKLAPKLAPFAKIIYFAGLVLMALRLIEAVMYGANFSILLLNLLMVVAEFAILRMFCEYLAASAPKAKK
ncbi:MAG: hypothetical protein II942_03330 [Alphaproteobacteria bacterium]|nr:hypothetical protein [Alphaproteobacteria bacterium]